MPEPEPSQRTHDATQSTRAAVSVPASEQTSSKGRPALATAGGLLLAVALLQIGQQVVGAFSPRPSVQAALAVAVGLAALSAERLRDVQGRHDSVALAAGGGSLIALGSVVAVSVAVGFEKPVAAPIAEQIAALQTKLVRDGFAVQYRQLSLAEGQPLHLFVLRKRPRAANEPPPSSDEVRLYGVSGGKLHELLAYRPVVRTFGENNAGKEVPGGTESAAFHIWTVADVDGDGQREVLASYDLNLAGDEYQRVIVMLTLDVAHRRYVLTPLLRVKALGQAATGLPTFLFGPAGTRPERDVWVSDLRLDAGLFVPDRATLATSLPRPEFDPLKLSFRAASTDAHGKLIPSFTLGVRLWDLDLSGGRPRVRPMCPLGPQSAVGPFPESLLSSGGFLGRPLADAMTRTGIGVGDLIDGQCLEAGS